ncbi:putative serine/threonine protein kinase [Trypanosoma rangeli]|uniref:non-specific serine/threonine protein kinase n=1 Tax=Trypanosoma rangeli TaxID=5698 RepID=A0A3R7L6L8_TRYRA|nr:putative serine/threonine protein kinase [Trypanosoma rangeli]RNF08669.1 putative serine/threonine protein kinase [Trypanosoma rangeli]|eukprot:RNF08669.1 putative serine/threonine protein kinase [Trypanosoma rangeli]
MGMDHYRILKRLGGTTVTHLAVDKQNEKKVVIKRLMDGTQGVQELNVSLRVRHPNIIPFLESFVHDGALYAVLAYAEGGDLEAHLEQLQRKKRPLQLLRVLRWFKQLIEALQCCHQQNIVHRDVKPSNIFLNADATELYLGDFGSAKALLRSALLTSTFVGTPIWTSPEVLTGTPHGFSSDVWSLGCVFYEMAALRRPFTATNFAGLVQQITSGDISPLPHSTPDEIRKITMSMLRVDPGKRWSLAKALALTEQAIKTKAHPPPAAKGAAEREKIERTPPPSIPRRAAGANPQRKQPPQLPQLPQRPLLAKAAPALEAHRDGAVADTKLEEWIHARNHDMGVIERYLTKFRQSDEQTLAPSPPSVVDAQRDRGRDRRRSSVATSPERTTLPPAEARDDEPRLRPDLVLGVRAHVTAQPPPRSGAAVQPQRRTASIKSNAKKKEQNETPGKMNVSPLIRQQSAARSVSGNALHAPKRIKSSHSLAGRRAPSPAPPLQQEEGKRLSREKREKERAHMLEMIREQKAKAQQERKIKGKAEARDAVAVEIVLPANLRQAGGAE